MVEFMKVLLSLSLSGTLLLLLIFLPEKLYKTKLSRTWQYYIWLVAALRFLLPFTPDITLVGGLFAAGSEMISVESMGYAYPLTIMSVDITEIETGNAAAGQSFPISISGCLFSLWLAFAMFFLLRKIVAYRKFTRQVRSCSMEVTDVEYIKKLDDCRRKRNIKRKAKLYHNAGIVSPIMIGIIHPCIILPAGQVKEEELHYIFNHELTHYKRRDMFYKWLVQLVICIHWFNPFVYFMRKEINRACELACDEAVISSLDDNGRRAYGDTLLSFLRKNNSWRNDFVSVTLTEGAEQVRERLGAIMDFQRKTMGTKIMTLALTAVFCACFAAAGAYAAEDTTPDNVVLGEIALGRAMLDGAVSNGTMLYSALPDGTTLGKTVMYDDTTSSENSLDNAFLHWHGTSSDIFRDIPEDAAGYIIIKVIDEDGSVGYSGWGIGCKGDVLQRPEMSGSMPEQIIQPLICDGMAEDGKVRVLIGSWETINEEKKMVIHNVYVHIPEDAEVVCYVPNIKND